MIHLGVNIDHVATLRNARKGFEPSPIEAAFTAARGGADSITVHLREDRRHIVDDDVEMLRKLVPLPLNLELSLSEEILSIAEKVLPYQATLVPERREEVTTECGLNVTGHEDRIKRAVERLDRAGIRVSLFVDPVQEQLEASKRVGAKCVELHTGSFSMTTQDSPERRHETERIEQAAEICRDLGLTLHAGHGLNYQNTRELLHLQGLRELNIGHSIVSRAVFTGLEDAVREMKNLISQNGNCR